MYGAAAEYALHSLLTLAASEGSVSVKDLAEYQQIPERFLAKVFTRLVKAKIVRASEGIAGGYALARSPEDISVGDILDAADPGQKLFACAEIRRNCVLFGASPPRWSTSGMCQIHAFMKRAERELRIFLATKTLADLGRELGAKAPQDFLKESEIWFVNQRSSRTSKRKIRHGKEQIA
jgi:Rrf2 family protein